MQFVSCGFEFYEQLKLNFLVFFFDENGCEYVIFFYVIKEKNWQGGIDLIENFREIRMYLVFLVGDKCLVKFFCGCICLKFNMMLLVYLIDV